MLCMNLNGVIRVIENFQKVRPLVIFLQNLYGEKQSIGIDGIKSRVPKTHVGNFYIGNESFKNPSSYFLCSKEA